MEGNCTDVVYTDVGGDRETIVISHLLAHCGINSVTLGALLRPSHTSGLDRVRTIGLLMINCLVGAFCRFPQPTSTTSPAEPARFP